MPHSALVGQERRLTIMNEFASELFEKFEAQITDQVFCFIENDRELMKAYLDLVAQTGDLRAVNSGIAQQVATHYGLKDSGERCSEPQSLLIQSYTILERN